MKRKIRLTETELINLINNIINEGGKYPDNRFGICLCPPPWTPCGCLGQAMSLGIPPEDMDPADFTGNDDDDWGKTERPDLMHQKRLNERTQQPPQQQQQGVTQGCIQQCKQILNNVPGTNAQWKQNFKQTVLGKPCNWVMNRYQFFGNKMQTVSPTSSAYQRYSAKSGFLECLLGCAC
jgi:hypothetical protein|tara:strand:+ start:2888 stop:3424 length:537 start_codon:yes stop_codon:yes gene_type:complete